MRRRSYEVEGLLERIRDLRERLDAAITRAETAEEQRNRLKAALLRHGEHAMTCQARLVAVGNLPTECDCGLQAALAEGRRVMDKPTIDHAAALRCFIDANQRQRLDMDDDEMIEHVNALVDRAEKAETELAALKKLWESSCLANDCIGDRARAVLMADAKKGGEG